jgi:hypothetical protein
MIILNEIHKFAEFEIEITLQLIKFLNLKYFRNIYLKYENYDIGSIKKPIITTKSIS